MLRLISVFILFLLLGGGISFFLFSNQTPNKENPKVSSPVIQETTSQFSVKNPPSSSLKANVTLFDGIIFWQERGATNSSEVTNLTVLQQGENVETKEKSNLNFTFNDGTSIDLKENTKLSIIQTLPKTMVFEQNSGNATYISKANGLSVRSFHLLLEQKSGEFTLNVDNETGLLTVEVIKGKVTAAYNDTDYISHVVYVPEGSSLEFDEETREAEVSN